VTSRVAIVSGAGSGICKATANALAADGFSLVLLDIDAASLEATASELPGSHACATVDVTDRAAVDAAVESAAARFGRIDAVVCAAGVTNIIPFLDLPLADWEKVVEVNLGGTFNLGQAAARVMVGTGGGSIVNVASTAGKMGRPLSAHYAASKFGVIGLTQSMALALAGDGIRVNAVCPGIIDTPMWERIDAELAQLHGREIGDAKREQVQAIPMRRSGTAEEVADLIRFLIGDGARYITGQAVNVSGGLVMH
jgi:meso-butanediol dehydrogenase/(S,S)-butanediol dehydrogenase/diacetyl reductase